MTQAIKAIETQYKGYRFRSRLEARWAVFFDALGMPWEYEPEGFDLGPAGWYLPDFWLPKLGVWCEIKGDTPTDDEQRKAQALAEGQGKNLIMLIGTPYLPDVKESFLAWPYHGKMFIGDLSRARTIAYDYSERYILKGLAEFLQEKVGEGIIDGPIPIYDDSQDVAQALISKDRQYFLAKYGREHKKWRFGHTMEFLHWYENSGNLSLLSSLADIQDEQATPSLRSAYAAARAARFEHGEHGGM